MENEYDEHTKIMTENLLRQSKNKYRQTISFGLNEYDFELNVIDTKIIPSLYKQIPDFQLVDIKIINRGKIKDLKEDSFYFIIIYESTVSNPKYSI